MATAAAEAAIRVGSVAELEACLSSLELMTGLLHIAAEEGHLEVCEVLVAAGALRSETDEDGQTPLHVAVASGHVDIAELLTRMQPCPEICISDKFKMTPLHLGCEEDNPESMPAC